MSTLKLGNVGEYFTHDQDTGSDSKDATEPVEDGDDGELISLVHALIIPLLGGECKPILEFSHIPNPMTIEPILVTGVIKRAVAIS